MRKIFIIFTIALAFLITQNKNASLVQAESINLNSPVKFDDVSNIFGVSLQNKEQTQLRTRTENNGTNTFMIKGVITAETINSLTIGSQIINIDPSVTGNVKTAGTVRTGMYAMVQGIVQNSTYYAQKIVVDQRNKLELREGQEISETPTPTASVTVTPTPNVTVTPTLTPTPEATQNANIEESGKGSANVNTLLTSLQNILSYLRQFVFNF